MTRRTIRLILAAETAVLAAVAAAGAQTPATQAPAASVSDRPGVVIRHPEALALGLDK